MKGAAVCRNRASTSRRSWLIDNKRRSHSAAVSGAQPSAGAPCHEPCSVTGAGRCDTWPSRCQCLRDPGSLRPGATEPSRARPAEPAVQRADRRGSGPWPGYRGDGLADAQLDSPGRLYSTCSRLRSPRTCRPAGPATVRYAAAPPVGLVGLPDREGTLSGLDFGGGVRCIGESWGDNENTFRVAGATFVDALVHDDWNATRLAVNATNLGDQRYMPCHGETPCYYFGEGDRVTASLSQRW